MHLRDHVLLSRLYLIFYITLSFPFTRPWALPCKVLAKLSIWHGYIEIPFAVLSAVHRREAGSKLCRHSRLLNFEALEKNHKLPLELDPWARR